MTVARLHRRSGLAPRVLLPVLLSGAVWALTAVLWGTLRAEEDRALGRAVEEHARQSAALIEGRAAERLLPYERMAHRWERSGIGDADEAAWAADARQYHRHHPELLAIEWVDATSRIRWVEPLEGNEAAVGLELNYEGTRAAARDRSVAVNGPAMTRVIELVQGGDGVLFFHPLWREDELVGHLVFVARPGPLADQLLGPADDRYEVSVYDGEHALLRREAQGLGEAASAELDVAGVVWRVEVRPTAQTVALYRSQAPLAVLIAGLALGLAFFGVAYLALLSQRRREALQRQSDEVQSILDLLPAMVWYKDTDNNILRANKTAADAAGVTPADMAGRPTADIYPDTAELFYRGDLEVMRSGVPRLGVVEPIDTDAGRRDVQTDKLPVVNDAGEVTGIIVIATDITHLKQAEAQARRATEWFEAFMANDPELKWALDTEGRFVYVNAAYQKAMDVTLEQCVGRHPIEVLPEQTKAFIRVAETMTWNRPTLDAPAKNEVHLPTKDGVVPLLFNQFLFQVEGGQVIEGGTAIDLTAVKQAERQLAGHVKDLETLLYVISHDLREPLRGIRNFTDLISTGYADRLDDRGRDMLARVARGADRLDRLLGDVLLLSRAQRADTPAERADTDEVVADVLHELQAAITQTGAAVRVVGDLPDLRMDRFWLRQAVLNLVSNALKFTRPGQPPDIEIAGYRPEPGESARGLVVRDRGPGVDPKLREKIFGLFQRGVGRDTPGTGAGLAIVAQIAERHGGRAWVRDRPGGGSEFVMTTSDNGE